MLLLIIAILSFGSKAIGESIIHVFSDSSIENPFYDPFVDTIVHLNRSALISIPRMSDEAFLQSLYISSPVRTYRTVQTVSPDNIDDQLVEQATIDKEWEDLVVSGPLSINYLAALLVLSSQKDFSFVRPTPDFVYRYIRYPNSFRTTLTQLSGEMYQTFLDAHTSMNHIQLSMQQIPRNIHTTLKVITQGSPRLIESILPSALNNIERLISDCVDSANGTANKFSTVIYLLQEIIELNENTISSNQNASVGIGRSINESLLEQEEILRQKQLIKEQCDESKVALKEAYQAYLDAVKGIPTRAPIPIVTMASTQSQVGIPSKPSRGFWCGLRVFCSKYKRQLAAYNEAVQRERERQENNRKIEEAFVSAKEAERQRIEREEKSIAEARQDATQLLELLKRAQDSYDEYYKELLQKENVMVSNIVKLSKLKLDEIDPKQTIEILYNATKELSKLKAQWDNLIKFFFGLAAQVSITHGVIVHEFVEYIQNTILASRASLDNATLEFFTELLIQPVQLTDRHSRLLYVMSKTYYDISSQYMMGQLAGFLTASTVSERETLLQQISVSALEVSAKISRLAQQRQNEYQQKISVRKKELAIAASIQHRR